MEGKCIVDSILQTVESAAVYAVLVIVTVEAVRKRVAFDGWRVLLVAAGVSLAIAALFLPAHDLPSVLAQIRIAVAAWLIAVGGDAWVAKIATRGKQTVITDMAFPSREAPTKKDTP